MRLPVDLHTHTIASGHAFSTFQEMTREAANRGVEMFAVTDHGPALPGAPHLWHFETLRLLPAELYGVRIIKGAEANIVDRTGAVDLPDSCLGRLEYVLAGMHHPPLAPGSAAENTAAVLGAMRNPNIDALAHLGNPQFPIDIERVVAGAKEYGKLIEINNHSFIGRTGSAPNCRRIALLCKEAGVRVVCGSDAHIAFDVGRFDHVRQLFKEIEMPEELVLNSSRAKFEEYLDQRKNRF